MNEQTSATVGTGLTGRGLFAWAVMMVKEPRRFFASLAKTGGYGTPVAYALFWIFLSAVVELAAGRVRPQPIRFGWGIEVGWLIAGPFILVGLGFIVSGVLFLIWHLMGSKENYETAFRCWAFTTPTAVAGSLLGIVPFLNTVALLYGLYLLVIASIETHRVPAKRAWIVWSCVGLLLVAMVIASLVARRTLQRQGFTGVPPVPGGTGQLPDMNQFQGEPGK